MKKSTRAVKAQSRNQSRALAAGSANAAGPGILALLESAEEALYQARAVIKMTKQALEGAEGCEQEYTALGVADERLDVGLDTIDRAIGHARALKTAAEEARS